MQPSRRRRQPGQAIVLAAVAMVAVLGGLAIAIDGGIFFVVQRQLQTAADAGALAGAWHDPVCPLSALPVNPSGLPQCQGGPDSAVGVAKAVAQANADTIKQLCGGGINTPTAATGTQVGDPATVNTIVVTVECNAGYSFGRILGLDRKLITASARAAIGDRVSPTNGDVTDFTTNPTCPDSDKCRIARLIS